MVNEELKDSLISILDQHQRFQKSRERITSEYVALYENRWSSETAGLFEENSTSLQTNHTCSYVDSFMSAIFMKYPSLDVQVDPTSLNDPKVVRAIVNQWLAPRRETFELATKNALIYPCSFIKLQTKDYDKDNLTAPLGAIEADVIDFYEIICDLECDEWDKQRYIAHVFDMELPKVISKYGNKDYKPRDKSQYFEEKKVFFRNRPRSDKFKYVRIVEFYDLLDDRLIVWTPDIRSSGFEILLEEEIPIRKPDGSPFPPIIPLYLNFGVLYRLAGLSAITKIYDKVIELNTAITHRANCVKRNHRKYIYEKETLDDLAIEDWQSSQDSTLIGVETKGRPLDQIVRQVAVAPLDLDFNIYIQELRKDLDEATTLPPWTRGVMTNATASEVQLGNVYAENQLGLMSRQRDEMFERVGELYIRMVHALLSDKAVIPVEVDGESVAMTREHLAGSFRYIAVDGGTAPGALKVKAQQLMIDAPQLVAMGANQKEILKEVIRLKEYPESLLEEEEVIPTPEAPQLPVDNAPINLPIQPEM